MRADGLAMGRVWGLCAALALYGLWSAPAPPVPGMAEMLIGALLLAGVGVRPLTAATGQTLREPAVPHWQGLATVAFAWLLWAPLLRGVALGWEWAAILRDVVPLVFLFLPVLLVPVLRRVAGAAVPLLAAALALAGVLFALRWWQQAGWAFDAVGARAMAEGAAYLLNAPSVLFAAVALPMAALGLAARGGWWRWAAALVLLAAAALCLGALTAAVHRMALAAAVIGMLATLPWWWRRAPRAVLVAVVLAVLGVAVAGDAVAGAVALAAEKTRLVGANARLDEAAAVLEQVAGSLPALLFGEGWGAAFANPAVGGWRVGYTHTLLSYALLKGGLFGVLAVLVYLAGLAPAALALLRAQPPLAVSVLAPLALAVGGHTAYKYLDCGILLTVLVLSAERHMPIGRRMDLDGSDRV